MPSYFFTIALGIELLEVSPNILGLLFILDSGKYHFGARNSRFGSLMYSSNVCSFHAMPEFLLALE